MVAQRKDIGKTDPAEFKRLSQAVWKAVDGVDASVAMSVLAQVLIQMPDGEVDAKLHKDRTVAILGFINLLVGGRSGVEFDQVSYVETIHDLTAIARCSSRAVLIPAMASVLVSSVANGRRNDEAESACVGAIRQALRAFEASL